MAQYTSLLKANTFITLTELTDHLAIQPAKFEVPPAEVKSFRAIQNILFTSKLVGVNGNAISVQYTSGATAGSEVVSNTGNAITVQIEDGVSTALQIKTAIEAFPAAHALVGLTFIEPSVGAEAQAIQGPTNLTGGVNDVPFGPDVERLRRLLEGFINTATDKIESILRTPVVAKSFTDTCDGNNSNVIIPSKWPITEVTEVKIDYNRGFGPETIIGLSNAVLRGFADKRQASTDTSIRIVGTDIALRDDGLDSFIGKIFSGSTIGAVQIKYKAGWASDVADIPSDLKYACMLLAEYYYYQRSNRDLNIVSKGVRGESYTKVKDGIPDTIYELLEPYIDVSFGLHQKSQTNTFDL